MQSAIVALLLGVFAVGSAPAALETVACPELERPLRERVKLVQLLDDFESTPSSWKTPPGAQAAQAEVQACRDEHHAGQASLRVDYQFTGRAGLEYVDLQRSLPLPADVVGLGFWLKRGAQPLHLAVRIADRSGEVHQFGLEEEPGDGWHFVACRFQAGSSWAGDGNHRLDKPLRLLALVFDRPQAGYRGKGQFWIDDLHTLAPVPSSKGLQVEVDGKRFGNVYQPGETLSLRVSATEGRVQWSVEDYWGETLAGKGASRTPVEISYTLAKPGFYRIVLQRVQDKTVAESRAFCCAALPDPADVPRDAFLGFCTHFGQNAYALELMNLLRRYGFRRFRDEVGWSSVEKQPGQYALPEHAARYLDHARKLSMEPLLIFDYANPLYEKGGFPNSPEGLAAFAKYAAYVAQSTAGTVREFEIWNEWIGGCGMKDRPGDHGPEAYGRLMQATYPAVRAVRPDARIVGIGGEYGPHCAENIATAIRTAGPKMLDAFSIHPYRYPRPPESSDLLGEVRQILDRSAACGAPRKTWITEIGYPTHRGRSGSDLRAQARHAVRTLALLQSCAGVDKVHWYDFKDDGLTPEYNEHNFGVVQHQSLNCAPKPAAVAMSVWARLTAGYKPEPAAIQSDLYAVKYRGANGNEALVLWTVAGKATLAVSGQDVHGFDLMGCSLSSAASVTVTEEPLYVLGRGLSWK